MITVTEISRYKGETMRVVIDNGTRTADIYLNRDIVAQGGIQKGMTVTSAQLRSLMAENERRRARERALFLLESREHSYKELYDKLCKSYKEETAASVCDELLDRGLVDDMRFAESLTRSLTNRKYGMMRIRQELFRRGIDRDIIGIVTAEADASAADDALMTLIRQKYASKLASGETDKVRNALARRGYTYSQIKEAIDSFAEEADSDR